MFVSRSIEINANRASVEQAINNYTIWQKWSPWAILEPEVKISVNEKADFYEWQGKRTGSGNMKNNGQTGDVIDMDLTFLKPWKSTSKIYFRLKEKDSKISVSWEMHGSLPFFMFFFKKIMQAGIGMDFERGLKMLKDYCETGNIHSKLEFKGVQPFNGGKYVGIKRNATMHTIGDVMQKDFDALFNEFNGSQHLSDVWFSQYHKFDIVNGGVEFTSAVCVTEYPENLPAGWVKGEIEKCNLHTIRHIGSYDHIGNAWAASQMMIRAKEFKPKKGIHPYEFYRNSPKDTAPENLISDICFAV
ncbi:MAG: SRPBCC family protein [Flavobacteriales bacterium]|nr:SRPBCC family protein [Flavobacteriales bacterium]